RLKWKFWLALLAAATLVGLLEAAQMYAGVAAMGGYVSWREALRSTLPSWYVLLALIPGILWLSKRFPFEPRRWHVALPVHLVAAVTFVFLHVTVSSWISQDVLYRGDNSDWDLRAGLAPLLAAYFVLELVTYFAVVVAYNAYDYSRRYRERE